MTITSEDGGTVPAHTSRRADAKTLLDQALPGGDGTEWVWPGTSIYVEATIHGDGLVDLAAARLPAEAVAAMLRYLRHHLPDVA